MYDKIWNVYFSPTASSRDIGRQIAKTMGEKLNIPWEDINQTTPEDRKNKPAYSSNDIIICAFPVYSGRVPDLFSKALGNFSGNGCLAVPVAVYGNRAFDDALLECADLLSRAGCKVIAGIAAIAQHTFDPQIAAGRPDGHDKAVLADFAVHIAEKTRKADTATPRLPGNTPYAEPAQLPPVTPLTSSACNYCGICVKLCPAGVISEQDPHQIQPGCILCTACVKFCPQKAKSLPDPFLDAIREKLETIASEPKEPELFI